MKKLIDQISTFVLILAIASCGQKSANETNGESGQQPQSMIEDEPVDDGLGIGNYKDFVEAEYNADLAQKGKVVFDAKCLACHKITDQKVVGPGLLGITKRRKAAWILNMITNPVEMTQKDPTAKDLLAEHLTQMTFQDVNDADAKAIYEYLRMVDGAGN
ncbi:MAG: cytochrome c [Flavobacteriales bacterium]|nr:cytochrome c [Flavobacteriales bacterium]